MPKRRAHPLRKTLAAPLGRDGDLPDKKTCRVGRGTMSRDPTHDPVTLLRDDAMVGEMGRLDEIAVGGIAIKRRTT